MICTSPALKGNKIPADCRIARSVNIVRDAYFDVIVYDGQDDFSEIKPEIYYGTTFVEKNFGKAEYCVSTKSTFLDAKVELLDKPQIAENGTIQARVSVIFRGHVYQQHCQVNWYLPEGWSVSGKKDLHIHKLDHYKEPCNVDTYVITAGEKVAAKNHIVVELQPVDRAESAFL